ncbi:MAG: hypothetical protein ABJH72_18675 [Reichenbachiella sp.]|uniref:hypothetical protein n=1 Tax=Reichenbachiella sp. TaxID=2184521 RepID=UPI00329A2CC4
MIRKIYYLSALLVFSFSANNLIAQDDGNEFDISLDQEDTDYSWQTPAGKYLEPSSFFSLHGYVNGVYAGSSDEWTNPDPTQLASPGQLLVPNSDNSSFQYDFAIIIGSELTERTRVAVEAHYVSDPSGRGAAGPGGLSIAVTEATGSYDLVPKALTISAGIFWSPFGIINKDWLGAQNKFSLVPRASGAYPVHYNERGIRVNGVFDLSENSAINYVVSLGNGLSNYNLSGQASYDNNDNKTITARIGFYPGLGKDLEIGLSYMNGKLRDGLDATIVNISNPERYGSQTSAFGIDAAYKLDNLSFQGYFVSSKEELSTDGVNSPGDIKRMGYTGEILYLFETDLEYLKGIRPKFRYDFIEVDQLYLNGLNVDSRTLDTRTLSFGSDIVISDNFRFGFDYNISTENGQTEIENDRFVGKLIAQF